MNTRTQTPVQIDTKIAELSAQLADAERQERNAQRSLDNKLAGGWSRKTEDELREALDIIEDAKNELYAQLVPLHQEFNARGGWTRYYLVTNVGGHVHKDTSCSTCRKTTSYEWLVSESGKTAEELVELAGERACSVCFAGLEGLITERPSKLSWDVEQREAAAAAKAEKDAEKKAKAAAAEARNGASFELIKLGGYADDIKNVRTAKIEAVRALAQYAGREWQGHSTKLENLDNLRKVRAALISVGFDWEAYKPELEKKAAAKARKEAREGEKLRARLGL